MNPDELLAQATCRILIAGQTVATAWLLDEFHIVSAGHVLGKDKPLDRVQVQFLDEQPRNAEKFEWFYEPTTGADCCILKLTEPETARHALPISGQRNVSGQFRLYGFGKTLVDQSSAIGTFVGNFHPDNRTSNRLFSLQTEQSRQQGFSGGAVFSDATSCVVAIQTEGTTVPAGAPNGTTVLAMPIYRIAQLCSSVPTLRSLNENTQNETYWFHVYLSYMRGGVEQTWLDKFFLDELKTGLWLVLGEEPNIFWDHESQRATWDKNFEQAIRRSCCMVPILSAGYWKSPECRAELNSFRARQKEENVSLMHGILFHQGGVDQSEPPLPPFDHFEAHNATFDGFKSSAPYGSFQEAVRRFAGKLATLIQNVPEAPDKWPVFNPLQVQLPASRARVKIGRPGI